MYVFVNMYVCICILYVCCICMFYVCRDKTMVWNLSFASCMHTFTYTCVQRHWLYMCTKTLTLNLSPDELPRYLRDFGRNSRALHIHLPVHVHNDTMKTDLKSISWRASTLSERFWSKFASSLIALRIYVHICVYVCMYVYLNDFGRNLQALSLPCCAYMCTYVYMYVCVYINVVVYTHTHIHTHIHTYIYVFTDIHTYIHTYIHT
jgi:hypothetical protein